MKARAMSSTPLDHLAPSHIRDMPTYVPGKPVEEAAREFGLDEDSIIKLASNENPLGMGAKAKAAVIAALESGARYPDGHGYGLRQALVKKLGVAADQLVLGNGSSDLIVMAASAFLTAEQSAVVSQYAFSAYFPAVRAQGAELVVAPAKDFGHDLDAMLAAIKPNTRLVFIANPNNPTGTMLSAEALKAFLEKAPDDVVVVLDEADREFQTDAPRPDSVAWINKHPNLIIFRTLSKAYGLAGLRIGFAIGSPTVAGLLNRVRQTFNTSLLAQAAALAALDDQDHLDATFTLNLAGLDQLYAGFDRLGLSYVPSAGNFVMVEIPQADAVYRALLRLGVIVRPLRPNYNLGGHLRISVGLPSENARFLETLASVLASQSQPLPA
jgi:histidinol-phosphate aminotransferase